LFNLEMITQGYAYEYTYNLPYKYQAVFQQAERAAREGQAGLWSQQTCAGRRTPDGPQTASPAAPADGTATPSRHDCPGSLPIKGNINSRGDRIYHTPDSPSYAQVVPEQCFATPADAEAAGFRAVR
jgi:micrococcal nuclease